MSRSARNQPRARRFSVGRLLVSLSACLLISLAVLVVVRNQRQARLEAFDTLHQFRADLQEARFLLLRPDVDRPHQDEGLVHCQRALDRFGVLANPSWRETGALRFLPVQENERAREEIAELLVLLARTIAQQAETAPPPAQREEQLQSAHRLNVLAETCYAPDHAPQAIWFQRADLAQLAGEETVAQCLRDKARQVPLRGGRDLYLAAQEAFHKKEFHEGIRLLQELGQDDPHDLWIYWLRAGCHASLGQHAKAAANYTACIALANAPWAYFSRGLAALEQKDYVQACADFDQALRLRPGLREAYVQRALAKLGLENQEGSDRAGAQRERKEGEAGPDTGSGELPGKKVP